MPVLSGGGSRLLIASVVIVAFSLGGRITSEAAPLPSKIVLAAAGGSYDECEKRAFAADWERKTNIKVEFGSPYYDMGSWKTQQQTGKVEWDVAPINASQAAELIDKGWLAPIDKSIITKNGGLLNFPNVTITKGGQLYTVPAEIFATVITYNTDKFGANPPQSWADVFNVSKYPGRRAFSKNVSDTGVLELALLADGVPNKKLYPLNVDRALRKLDTIKDRIIWYETGAQLISLFQQGEAVIGSGWDGRVKFLKREGGHVDFTRQQTLLHIDYLTIPRGAHVELANQFIAFITQPRLQAKFAACIGYSPGWKEAYKYLPTGQTFTITDIRDLSKYVIWNLDYWKANRRTITDRFNQWLSK